MGYVVEMREISKQFPAVLANNRVSLCVESGTIHAIIGENGAGKTTLMNILYGLYQPDGGEILIKGERVSFRSAMDAIRQGIGMVHQHFMLIPRLSVADNIVLGDEPRHRFHYDRRRAEEQVNEVCRNYGIAVDPTALVQDISLGMQQRVEIVKTLYRGADVIILDEPTAVLTPQEIDDLGMVLKRLKERGKTILIITHKLEEVMDFSDEITVLRAGRHVVTVKKEDTSIPELTAYMVGREVHLGGHKTEVDTSKVMLQLSHVSCHAEGRQALQNISFTLHSGEILGIAGVDGSGQTELTEVVAGILPCQEGSVAFQGREITGDSIAERKANGIGFIAQDRHRHGLILDFSVEENLLLGMQRRSEYISRRFLQDGRKIRAMAEERIRDFDIRPPLRSSRASTLSGGNQQKIIVAREMGAIPELIVADQPTRGVDVGAIEFIHNTLVEHRNRGGSVLLTSLELDEVLMLSDRIAVMYCGRLVGIVDAKSTTREQIGLMMVGRRPEEVES